MTAKKELDELLFRPINNSTLIFFRICFGFLLAVHFFTSITNGTVFINFIEPAFNFPHIGFEFLQPLPGRGMYIYFALLGILSLFIMIGAWYRIAMVSVAILFTGIYLMQKSGYNNHYYLLLLICWIMCFLPAHRRASFDTSKRKIKGRDTCLSFSIFILLAQIAIMYFFAALSKIDGDWFTGKFIAIQFSKWGEGSRLGFLYGSKAFQLFICYAGFLFDLLIVPLLLWRRTRSAAFLVSILFHLFNAYTFSIGIFPYLSIALNTLFLPASTFDQLFRGRTRVVHGQPGEPFFPRHLIKITLSAYLLIQLLLPMRSWFYPGNVFWTEEGYRLSWKMMMRTKSGDIFFRIRDPQSGKTWTHDPARLFKPQQLMWIAGSPDMTWQYAQRLAKDFKNIGYEYVQVFAVGSVSLNRSKPKPLIDSTVDLAHVKWEPFRHSSWITNAPK